MLLWLYFGWFCSTYFLPWKFGMYRRLADARLPLTLPSSPVMLSGSAVEHNGTWWWWWWGARCSGSERGPQCDLVPADGADPALRVLLVY